MFACVFFLAAYLPTGSLAENNCSSSDVPLFSEQATGEAGLWANLRKKPGSIRVNSDRLLTKGLSQLSKDEELQFSSVPRKFLEDYSDKATCDELALKTRKERLVFPVQTFATAEEVSEWIAAFSQGKGKLGKQLYRQCPGSCSPQYHYRIKQQEQQLTVTASVVCGAARDKDDNIYLLKAETVRSCEKPTSGSK